MPKIQAQPEPGTGETHTASAATKAPAAEAEACLREQGGELRVESSVPDGTSAVLLFPFAAEDSGWQGVPLPGGLDEVA